MLTEFFRHCPSCGRRFHIKLEDKKLVTHHMETLREAPLASAPMITGGRGFANAPLNPTYVHEGKPIIIDVEEFRYAYKCAHCGHEWSETKTEEREQG